MRLELFYYFARFQQTTYQFKGKHEILQCQFPLYSTYPQAFYLITGLRYFFHFHFILGANEQKFRIRISPLQLVRYGHGGINMSSRSSSRKYKPISVHLILLKDSFHLFHGIAPLNFLFYCSHSAQFRWPYKSSK